MRILYLLTSLGIGGAEKQTIALAESMASLGHVVSLLVLKHTVEECPARLPVMRLNMSKTLGSLLPSLRFARGFLLVFQPDLIHSHTFPANMFARLLRIELKANSRRPLLLNTIHNVFEGGWLRMMAYRLTGQSADWVTCVSNAAAERFIRIGAISSGRSSVLTNGIDLALFTPDRKRRKRMRAMMRVPSDIRGEEAFIWIAAGRIAPAKNYPNLLRAFAFVHEQQPTAQLWIAGEGDPASLDQSYMNGVSFLGLRSDIADLLDAADGFVLSSAWEGLPLVVGEAMSMAKVVVATDVGGVRELVGDCGLLVPAGDSIALAKTMIAVMQRDSAQRSAIGKSARGRIQSHFSMQTKVAEWQSLYQHLLETGSA